MTRKRESILETAKEATGAYPDKATMPNIPKGTSKVKKAVAGKVLAVRNKAAAATTAPGISVGNIMGMLRQKMDDCKEAYAVERLQVAAGIIKFADAVDGLAIDARLEVGQNLEDIKKKIKHGEAQAFYDSAGLDRSVVANLISMYQNFRKDGGNKGVALLKKIGWSKGLALLKLDAADVAAIIAGKEVGGISAKSLDLLSHRQLKLSLAGMGDAVRENLEAKVNSLTGEKDLLTKRIKLMEKSLPQTAGDGSPAMMKFKYLLAQFNGVLLELKPALKAISNKEELAEADAATVALQKEFNAVIDGSHRAALRLGKQD